MVLKFVMFLVSDDGNGFDTASLDDNVTLYYHNEYDKELEGHMIIERGTLREVNGKIDHIQKTILADMIRINPCDIDALVCVSCKPDLFHDTFEEAAEQGIPVTGTGGSSLSEISSRYGIKLIGNAGGSVATTPYTKAISFTYALSKHFNLTYQPWLKNDDTTNTNGSAAPTLPTWRSVLNSCLQHFGLWHYVNDSYFKLGLHIHMHHSSCQKIPWRHWFIFLNVIHCQSCVLS